MPKPYLPTDAVLNLDTRPAIEILSEAWDTSVTQDTLALNDKYGAAGFYEISQELEDAGYYFYKCGDPTLGDVSYTGFINSSTYNGYVPAPQFDTNSNVSNPVNVKPNAALSTTIENDKVKVSPVEASSTSKWAGFKTFACDVAQAVSAAQIGISLGKFIDEKVYNLFPDYWDSIGMSTLNPETWSTITHNDNSFAANAFNTIMGINPDTMQAQTFIDENAFAYVAQVLANEKWFEAPKPHTNKAEYSGDMGSFVAPHWLPESLYFTEFKGNGNIKTYYNSQLYLDSTVYPVNPDIPYYVFYPIKSNKRISNLPWIFSTGKFSYWGRSISEIVINGVRYYYLAGGSDAPNDTYTSNVAMNFCPTVNFPRADDIIRMIYGTEHKTGGVDGITDNPDSVQPDVSNWTNQQNTLDSLRNQYPDIFGDPIQQSMVQPDGTVKTINYVPVPMPSFAGNPSTATQPITTPQTATQTNPTTSLENLTSPLLDIISGIAAPTTPYEPPVTGSGTTPIPATPDGTASALWSVYHPTQQQVNDFGAWLWTDNVITQFLQAMNNPMDGIITLHKIFAMPVDSGNGTIVIGRLDSQVPTAFVTQQYVTVDCGSVSVQEYFGNVFDYVGTQISIYLPFIGIQPLNVDDVMRSTLNVVYKVDLFTGACLATINVNRDGCNPMMYQFTGVCSVEYPLTGGQHSSIINGFFGLMGAGVATAAGPAGPIAAGVAAIGMASSINQIVRTQNARSGAFGANAGAMGIKKPYLIISRPQTKVARQDTHYTGYSTNYTDKVSAFTGMVKARQVHVEGVNATDTELEQIESMLKEGILV
jgi:hypothetical protein